MDPKKVSKPVAEAAKKIAKKVRDFVDTPQGRVEAAAEYPMGSTYTRRLPYGKFRGEVERIAARELDKPDLMLPASDMQTGVQIFAGAPVNPGEYFRRLAGTSIGPGKAVRAGDVDKAKEAVLRTIRENRKINPSLPAIAGIAAAGALASEESEAAPTDKAVKPVVDVAKKIVSKFNEPRAALARQPTGGFKLGVELPQAPIVREPNAAGVRPPMVNPGPRTVTVSSDQPEELINMYEDMFVKRKSAAPSIDEIRAERAAASADDATDPLIKPTGSELAEDSGLIDKTFKALDWLPKTAYNKIAEKLGKKSDSKDSSEAAGQIVDALSEMGGSEDSQGMADILAKTAVATGLEFFSPSPLPLIGPAIKGAKNAKALKGVMSAISGGKVYPKEAVKVSQNLQKMIDETPDIKRAVNLRELSNNVLATPAGPTLNPAEQAKAAETIATLTAKNPVDVLGPVARAQLEKGAKAYKVQKVFGGKK